MIHAVYILRLLFVMDFYPISKMNAINFQSDINWFVFCIFENEVEFKLAMVVRAERGATTRSSSHQTGVP